MMKQRLVSAARIAGYPHSYSTDTTHPMIHSHFHYVHHKIHTLHHRVHLHHHFISYIAPIPLFIELLKMSSSDDEHIHISCLGVLAHCAHFLLLHELLSLEVLEQQELLVLPLFVLSVVGCCGDADAGYDVGCIVSFIIGFFIGSFCWISW